MTCCYTLIRGQLDPLEPMYVWKWCHCYHSYLIQDCDAEPCTSKLLWFMMHINNAHTCIQMLPATYEYDTPQTRGYERNSLACRVQWCPSNIVSTSRVALLLFNEIGRYVQVTITTWEKKQVVTVFTCQHNKIWKQRICRPFHSVLMTSCYTLIRGQLDPLEPMYVWK